MQTDRDALVQDVLRSAGAVVRAMRRQPLEGAEHAPVWVLMALTDGGVRATALAQRMHLDVSTVSRHLDALVAQGLVERQPDPADGRARLAVLTDDGRAHLHRLKSARRGVLVEQLSSWDDDDLATFAALISRLALGASQSPQEGTHA